MKNPKIGETARHHSHLGTSQTGEITAVDGDIVSIGGFHFHRTTLVRVKKVKRKTRLQLALDELRSCEYYLKSMGYTTTAEKTRAVIAEIEGMKK